MTVPDPRELALRIRLRAVRMVAPQGFGYLGQALSSAEQVAAVFASARPGVDRIVCSPGHYIIGPFAAAAELGLVDVSGYGQNGSAFEAIGTERSPVVDYTCGSLGQGVSAALGFALADRFRGSDARIFTMVSDGELEEGQVWEAALFAAHHRLDRLTVLLDANNSQVDGPVDTITTLEPIAAKWSAFGWRVWDVDGHDVSAVGEHDEHGRGAGPLRLRPVRAHLRGVRHAAAVRPDRQRDCLPEPAGAHHRVHARRVNPGRAIAPGHRRRGADAGA